MSRADRELRDQGEVIRRLEAAGEWPHPPGLEFHVLYGAEGSCASEIWDSPESLEAYFQKVGPIMNEVGIEMASEPEVFEVHNLVKR
jgi:hypothetical protein